MFVRGHTVLFLYLYHLDSKTCHKFSTHNCVPQVIVLNIINVMCDLAIIKLKSHQRELGSSLPIIGGGDSMTEFEKFYLIILTLELLIHFIDLFK